MADIVPNHPQHSALVTFTNFNPIKLTRDNYPLWLPQIVPHLRGGNLFGYVDGTIPQPEPNIEVTNADGVTTTSLNPAYLHWTMQDQLILGAITSALSENMISHVARCKTSRSAWTTLETLFVSRSRARTMHVRYQLATLKKGNTSIADYYQKFQSLADSLAAVDQPLNESKTYISRDVIFNENIFPFTTEKSPGIFSPTVQSTAVPSSLSIPRLHDYLPEAVASSSSSTSRDNETSSLLPTSAASPSQSDPATSNTPHSPSSSPLLSPMHPSVAASPTSSHTPHHMITRAKNNITKPKKFHDGIIRYPLPKALIAESTPQDIEPTCYTLAMKDQNWRQAMNVEFDALLKNQTWKLVPPSAAYNVIGCKWVFQLKRKADGSIDRYKARLVAKGFHQQSSIDYGETYSPVVKPIIGLRLSIKFISSKDQLADIFTKPLSSSRFGFLRSKINVLSIPLSLRGRVRDLFKSTHISHEDEAKQPDKDS
jgi:hypothetical protein